MGTIEERMAKHTKRLGPDECWPWLAHRNADGYGVVSAKSLGMGIARAHRVAFVLARGPIPDGLNVLHRCDNPSCVNPRHLWLGTQRENNDDKIGKCRQPILRGEQHGRAKLTAEDVATIRKRFTDIPLPKYGCQHSSHPNFSSIAREFGIARSTVTKIVRGKIWSPPA